MSKKWTDEEIETVRKLFKTHTKAEISKIIGKSDSSIQSILFRYNIRKNSECKRGIVKRQKWTKGDFDIIKNMLDSGASIEKIANTLNRSYGSIRHIISSNGWSDSDARKWTDEEEKILLENRNLSAVELMKLLPGRTKISINAHRHVKDIKRYEGDPLYHYIGNTRKHIVVMENSIGRKLNKNEIVHHINGVKLDNRIENLYLTNNNEHKTMHNKLNALLRTLLPELILNGTIKFENGIYSRCS